MTSIAVKTAAVPAIVCSSAYRSNDGATRRHPSAIGPGFLRSAGTSLGVMRNKAYPLTSPTRFGRASSPVFDENRSILRSVTLKTFCRQRPAARSRATGENTQSARSTHHKAAIAEAAEISGYAFGSDCNEPPWRLSLTLASWSFQSHSQDRGGPGGRKPCLHQEQSQETALGPCRNVRRRHDRALPHGSARGRPAPK